MTISLGVRADARALAGAAVLGSMVGLAIGGAYLAGGMARAASVHAQISRLAAHSDNFSETALTANAASDWGAVALARRHDPYRGVDLASNDRRLIAFERQLETHAAKSADAGMFHRVSLPVSSAPTPAAPFQMRGALAESRDLECLTQAVYYEARGETRAGQAAVAQVVLNRTRHPAFPKTVCGVVFQRARATCQFSFACDGSIGRRVEKAAWRRAEQVAAKALDGSVMAEVGNATHFHVSRLNPGWNLLKVGQVGSHVFYRFGGRAGRPSAFSSQPQPSQLETAPLQAAEEAQPVYASLSLAPLANTVANSMANSVVSTMTAVANAATNKPHAEAAKPASSPVAPPAAKGVEETPTTAAIPAPVTAS